jgi:signal transduction histidine kinase
MGEPRFPRAAVRLRITAVAVAIVAAVLTLASVALVLFVDRSLTDQGRTAAATRADAVVSGPDPEGATIAVADAGDEFVQVLDASGAVVASSANVEGAGSIARPSPGTSVETTVPFEEGAFVVVSAADGERLVVVGRSLDDVGEATAAVGAGLAIGVPVVALVVGALAWWLVGRALAPVEAMRAEVERIGARDLDRRLPISRADDEIGRLGVTLNRMLDRLEAAQERQRRFVSDASHELRSPIASIREQAEVARAYPDRARVEDLADGVLEQDRRLQALVDDLLLLARLDEGAPPGATSEVDVDDLVLVEAARVRSAAGLSVHTRGIGPGRVAGSADQLSRLLRNLVDNAARHARSTVALGVSTAGGGVTVTVDDDGRGVPEHDRERAFERFVRLDEGRARDDGGTGLGLAIAREIARAHGGDVQLDTAPLGGLRATVRLPACT